MRRGAVLCSPCLHSVPANLLLRDHVRAGLPACERLALPPVLCRSPPEHMPAGVPPEPFAMTESFRRRYLLSPRQQEGQYSGFVPACATPVLASSRRSLLLAHELLGSAPGHLSSFWADTIRDPPGCVHVDSRKQERRRSGSFRYDQ